MTIIFLITSLIFILGFLVLLGLGLTIAILIFTKVPYAGVPRKILKLILKNLEIKPGMVIYDLGCGDGRFLLAAEKSGTKTYGFELAPFVFLKAQWRIWRQKSQTKIFYRNFFKTDISDADIVFIFLVDKVMPNVRKLLSQQLKKGARVVSYGFPLPDWPAEQIINRGRQKSKIYFYRKN